MLVVGVAAAVLLLIGSCGPSLEGFSPVGRPLYSACWWRSRALGARTYDVSVGLSSEDFVRPPGTKPPDSEESLVYPRYFSREMLSRSIHLCCLLPHACKRTHVELFLLFFRVPSLLAPRQISPMGALWCRPGRRILDGVSFNAPAGQVSF